MTSAPYSPCCKPSASPRSTSSAPDRATWSAAAAPASAAGLEVAIPPSGPDLKALLFQIEQSYCAEALRAAGGNRGKAACMLGLNAPAYRKALRERLGLQDEE
jgi:DNA-binding NtrC family response regulator